MLSSRIESNQIQGLGLQGKVSQYFLPILSHTVAVENKAAFVGQGSMRIVKYY